MHPRLLLTTGLVAGLVAGCGTDGGEREPGDAVTREEATVLADLLHDNYRHGGADFVVTVPYAEDALLTLTGEVDFRGLVARGQAVTTFADGRSDSSVSVVFTPEDIWFDGVPGLPKGALRRPVVTDDGEGPPRLLDVVVELLLNLSARADDDPDAFLGGEHTWQGQRSIDGRLTTVFGLREGRTVAVGATDDLLTQFVTPLADGELEVKVTLSDHGRREIPLPAGEATAEAADHPELAAGLGL